MTSYNEAAWRAGMSSVSYRSDSRPAALSLHAIHPSRAFFASLSTALVTEFQLENWFNPMSSRSGSVVIHLDLASQKLLIGPDDPMPEFFPRPRAVMVTPIYDDGYDDLRQSLGPDGDGNGGESGHRARDMHEPSSPGFHDDNNPGSRSRSSNDGRRREASPSPGDRERRGRNIRRQGHSGSDYERGRDFGSTHMPALVPPSFSSPKSRMSEYSTHHEPTSGAGGHALSQHGDTHSHGVARSRYQVDEAYGHRDRDRDLPRHLASHKSASGYLQHDYGEGTRTRTEGPGSRSGSGYDDEYRSPRKLYDDNDLSDVHYHSRTGRSHEGLSHSDVLRDETNRRAHQRGYDEETTLRRHNLPLLQIGGAGTPGSDRFGGRPHHEHHDSEGGVGGSGGSRREHGQSVGQYSPSRTVHPSHENVQQKSGSSLGRVLHATSSSRYRD